MTDVQLKEVFRSLAQTAAELAKICDRDIPSFADSWHLIARNARVLEAEDSVDLDDVRSILGTISSLYDYHPGAFTEKYISRAEYDEQVRENEKFDALKKQVSQTAGEIQTILKIDPRSY